MKQYLSILLSALIAFSPNISLAAANKTQKQGVKTSAECIAAGATDATCLLEDAAVYVTANGLNKTLSAAITAGDISGGGGGNGLNQNMLSNPGADANSTTGWTASGGSFASTGTSGEYRDTPSKPYGFKFNASASSQTVTATTGWVVASGSTRNGLASGYFKGTATDYIFQVYDGTNVITSQTIAAYSSYQLINLNFVAAGGSTYYWRVISQSDAADQLFDTLYIGDALNFSSSPVSNWTSYTPTGNWTTNTTYTGKYRCTGQTLEIAADVTLSGAPGGSTNFTVGLPSSFTGDTTNLPGSNDGKPVGTWYGEDAGTLSYGGACYYTVGSNAFLCSYNTSPNVITKTNPFTFGASDFVAIKVALPSSGCVSSAVISPSTPTAPTIQTFLSGSGTYTTPQGVKYLHVRMIGGGGGGAGGGTTSATAATAGGDTTFGTSLLTANGGGASTRGGAGASGGAASIISPAFGTALSGANGESGTSYSGVAVSSILKGGMGGSSFFGGGGYGGCFANDATGANGTTNAGSGGGGGGTDIVTNGATGAGGGTGGFIDAIIVSPSSTYAYSVGAQGSRQAAGTNGAAGGFGSLGYIEVTEYYSAYNAPLFIGSVTSNSSGAERIERARINAVSGGSCTISSQSGTWITSTTPNALGDCTLTIASGMFSATPTCVANLEDNFSSVTRFHFVANASSVSTTSVRIQANYIDNSLAFASSVVGDASPVSVVCYGPR